MNYLFILFLIHYFTFLILIMLYVCCYNNNNCIEGNLCFRNLTLTFNTSLHYSCISSTSLNLPFHSNRKWTNNPKFIVATIYMYPSQKKYYNFIKFVRSFSISNKGEILLIVSCNISLYNNILSTKYITEIKSINKMFYIIRQLDNGYYIFKYSNKNSYCYILYTNIIQNYFSNEFINKIHHTMNNRKYRFSGYYAASTNLYSVLPFILKIFDYFDYYFKYDFDKPGIINIKEFALNNINNNRWYLFGTCLSLDAPFICNNVKNMTLEYVHMKKCSKNIVSAVELLTNDCIQFPGWFTGMWLGLYTSNEMRDFSNFYITYKYGIKYYRWGDQQFYVNSLLLFSGRNKISYNLTYNCIINNISLY